MLSTHAQQRALQPQRAAARRGCLLPHQRHHSSSSTRRHRSLAAIAAAPAHRGPAGEPTTTATRASCSSWIDDALQRLSLQRAAAPAHLALPAALVSFAAAAAAAGAGPAAAEDAAAQDAAVYAAVAGGVPGDGSEPPTDLFVTALAGLVFVLLILVTAGVGYLTLRSWLDERQEKQDQEQPRARIVPASSSDDEDEAEMKRRVRVKREKRGFGGN